MGTFHQGKGELHGITILVDTHGDDAYIGRCDTVTADGVILRDADVYDSEEGGPGKDAWVSRAAKVGVWKKYDELFVPAREVASITRLRDVSP